MKINNNKIYINNTDNNNDMIKISNNVSNTDTNFLKYKGILTKQG